MIPRELRLLPAALLLLLPTALAANATHNGTFMVLAPKVFRPGLPYTVWLNLLRGQPDIVRVSLRDKDNQTLAQSFLQEDLNPGTQTAVALSAIPPGLSPSEAYSVYVKGETVGGTTLFEASSPVRFDAKAESLFIQTDKGIYKPGSTVHFRVVAVDPALRPLAHNLSVKVLDPQSNVILQSLDAALSKGVFGRELELSDQPPLGNWRIEAETAGGRKVEASFTVEKYVLPKFEVTVEPPAFVTVADDIVVTVKAKYTYGKGVAGRAEVVAAYPWHYYGNDANYGPISHSIALQDGEATVRFNNDVLKQRNLVNEWGYNRIKFTATVTEELTGIARNGTGDVVAYKHAAKVKVTKSGETFKPGLPFGVLLAALQQDDSPIPAAFEHSALLKVEYEFPYSDAAEQETPTQFEERTVTLESDGTAAITLAPPAGTENIRIEMRYDAKGAHADSEVTEITRVGAAKSPSNAFLQLKARKGKVALGEEAVFELRTTEEFAELTWIVMSRGRVLSGEKVALSADGELTELRIRTTAAMAPKSRLVIYGVKAESKEILVDAMDFETEGLFRNPVSLSLSKNRAEPGQAVEVRVSAAPDSFVGVVAVDQSVLLLKSPNEITPQMVEQEMAAYDTTGWGGGGWGGPWPGPGIPRIMERRRKRSTWIPWWGIGGKDAATVFENAGIEVLTDAYLYREPFNYGPYNRRGQVDDYDMLEMAAGGAPVPAVAEAGEPNLLGAKTVSGGAAVGGESEPPRVRKEFPETWLWTNALTGSNGEMRESATIPDTITSWVASAFAVHDEAGLGVAPSSAKLTVFRPFFVRLNLPYSVKQAEHLALQALVFNYQTEPQWVTVTLDESGGFELLPRPGKPSAKEKVLKALNQRRVRVPGGGGAVSVFFPIVPRVIGDLKLKLTAQAANAGDAIEKTLLVEPEGYRVDKSQAVVLEAREGEDASASVAMDFPAAAVPGSQRAQFTLVGDVMGPVLSTAQGLIRMPYGCGEQNMLNFVPNIVVLRYLKATSRLTPALEKKALKYMEAGYQRELTYKRSDASFSAFGDRDDQGSTWLTAFVVRAFREASEYMFVDPDILAASMRFLESRQAENGEFRELGEVHHKSMQGGSGQGGVPLTAYVLIALLRNGRPNADALNYIEQGMDAEKDSPYTMALVAYALHLAGSPKAAEALETLNGLATEQNGQKHWADKVGEERADKPSYWTGPRPVDVEATAYGLLTLMQKGDVSGGLPVVRWLTGQRSALGGYSSTQDTVMALQALGAYAERAYSPDMDLTVRIDNGGDEQSFTVNADNSILLRSTDLAKTGSPVSVTASGAGMAFAQVGWSYYLKEERSDAPFHCDKETLAGAGANDVLLSLCCKYRAGGKSNMAVLELDALSGYAMDEEALNGLTAIRGLQRVELAKQDAKANIYFSYLTESPLCLNVSSQRVHGVSEQRPAAALLYDYYDPEQRVEMRYEARQKVSLQQACPSCWDNIPLTADAASTGLSLSLAVGAGIAALLLR